MGALERLAWSAGPLSLTVGPFSGECSGSAMAPRRHFARQDGATSEA